MREANIKLTTIFSSVAYGLVFCVFVLSSWAADYPAPNQGAWLLRDFRFHTGEVLPELRLHYTTVGAASGEPVLTLHGSRVKKLVGSFNNDVDRRRLE